VWRSKKLIMTAILAVVVLAGSIGGAVLAADGDEDIQPEAPFDAMLERISAIYQEKTGTALDTGALKDAMEQAQSEMRTEAMREWLQSMVDAGRITQEQADQYLEWQQARPDVPFRFGQHGPGKFRGKMGGCFGWGGKFAPAQPGTPAQ